MNKYVTNNSLILIDQSYRARSVIDGYPLIPSYKVRNKKEGSTFILDKVDFTILDILMQPCDIEGIQNQIKNKIKGISIEEILLRLGQLTLKGLIVELRKQTDGKKARLIRASEKKEMIGIEISPRIITWGSTENCNLRCRHCINHEILDGIKNSEMTIEECSKLFNEMDEYAVENLQISGGEPLIRNNMDKILELTADLSFFVALFTNGIEINEKWIKVFENILRKKPWGLGLHISLDGATAETHDFVRGISGSFNKLIQSMEALQSAGIPLYAAETMATNLNINEIERIIEICLRYNIQSINIHPVYQLDKRPLHKSLQLDFKNRIEFFNIVKKLQKEYKNQIKIIYTDPFFPVKIFKSKEQIQQNKLIAEQLIDNILKHNDNISSSTDNQILNKKFGFIEPVLENCSSGISKMYISPNGDSYPCLLYKGSSIDLCGNICKDSLMTLWESEGMNRARKPIRKEDLKLCKHCPHFFYCGSKIKKCRIASELSLGDFYGPSKHCLEYAEALGIPKTIVCDYLDSI